MYGNSGRDAYAKEYTSYFLSISKGKICGGFRVEGQNCEHRSSRCKALMGMGVWGLPHKN